MTEIASIERECRALTRYLIGREPAPYVIEKYTEAHLKTAAYSESSRFGQLLTRIARTHPALAKAADSYARLFIPHTLLRRKLVLLLAILETCAPSYSLLEGVDPTSRPLLLLHLALRGTGALLSLFAGSLLFFPLQLILGRERKRD